MQNEIKGLSILVHAHSSTCSLTSSLQVVWSMSENLSDGSSIADAPNSFSPSSPWSACNFAELSSHVLLSLNGSSLALTLIESVSSSVFEGSYTIGCVYICPKHFFKIG